MSSIATNIEEKMNFFLFRFFIVVKKFECCLLMMIRLGLLLM